MQRRRTFFMAAGAGIASICLAPLSSAVAEVAAETPTVSAQTLFAAKTDLQASTPMNQITTSADHSVLKLVADSEPPILAGNPALVPLAWAGKYIFPTGNGDNYSACTAQFITSRVILLAAHCVKDQGTGQFYPKSGAKFLLQYQNGDYSKAYNVVCQGTYSAWAVPLRPGEDLSKPNSMTPERQKEYQGLVNQAYQWDYAFILLDSDSITGHYNYSLNVQWNGAFVTGYPHALMGGRVIQAIHGDVFSVANLASQAGEPNEQVLWQGNPDVTYGASGGAWVANYSSQVSPDTNIIISVNSYVNDARPGATFGPLFTDAFVKLLNYVQEGCK